MKKSALIISTAMLATTSFATYTNDFEGPVGTEWSNTTTSTFNGTTILGRFGNESVTLTLGGYSVGDVVTIGFDVYALDSWDGNGTTYGPDHFTFDMNGNNMLNTTFSNVDGSGQSFPDAFGSGNHPERDGADNYDFSHGGTLPDGYFGNSLYVFGGAINGAFTTVATGSTMTFTFGASNLQGIGDESWAIDNVNVNLGSPVPEPCSMVVLAAGILGLARRRRK